MEHKKTNPEHQRLLRRKEERSAVHDQLLQLQNQFTANDSGAQSDVQERTETVQQNSNQSLDMLINRMATGDPITDDQWNTLRNTFDIKLNAWLTVMCNAIIGMRDAMKDGDEEEGSFAVPGLISALLGAVPGYGDSFAIGIELLNTIGQAVVDNSKDDKVTYGQFSEPLYQDINDLMLDTDFHDRMFSRIKKLTPATDTYADVNQRITDWADKLPKLLEMERSLLLAWVNSAEDSIDNNEEVGVIYVEMQRFQGFYGKPVWTMTEEPFLDDVENQAGTIAAIKRFYPGDKLENLPFKIFLTIREHPNSVNAMHHQYAEVEAEKQRATGTYDAAPVWKRVSGDKELYEAWITSGYKPTVNDLVTD